MELIKKSGHVNSFFRVNRIELGKILAYFVFFQVGNSWYFEIFDLENIEKDKSEKGNNFNQSESFIFRVLELNLEKYIIFVFFPSRDFQTLRNIRLGKNRPIREGN